MNYIIKKQTSFATTMKADALCLQSQCLHMILVFPNFFHWMTSKLQCLVGPQFSSRLLAPVTLSYMRQRSQYHVYPMGCLIKQLQNFSQQRQRDFPVSSSVQASSIQCGLEALTVGIKVILFCAKVKYQWRCNSTCPYSFIAYIWRNLPLLLTLNYRR